MKNNFSAQPNTNKVQAIAEIANLILTDGETALPRILEIGASIVKADYGNIFIHDKDTRKLKSVAQVGYDVNWQPQEISLDIQSIPGYSTLAGVPYRALDVTKDFHYFQLDEQRRVRSEIAVPLLAGGEVLGVINFESAKVNHFTEEHERFIEVLASLIANSLHRVELESRGSAAKEILESKKPLVFVLMPFRDPFDKYYRSIIKPAIEDSGMLALRADEIFGPTEIIQDIWKAINNAELIIAELTTRNPNVMYELGLCHAIGKHVIMVSQSVDDLPFDLRSLRCILYDTIQPNWAELLREILIKSIKITTSDETLEHVFLKKNKA